MKPQCEILVGDVLRMLRTLPDESVHCVVTSPPYWGLRDYGVEGQIGLEPTPEIFLEKMVQVFRDVRRALRSDGTLWLNMGDSYFCAPQGPALGSSGLQGSLAPHAQSRIANAARKRYARSVQLKEKDLVGMPWRLALALQDDGWYLRQDIIWHKSNPMPESVQDRCTKAHEYIFLLSKSDTYFFDSEAIKEKASTNSHSRGGGVNPKAMKGGQHSRMRVDRDPRHAADKIRARAKQNASFSEAVTQLVTHRNKRSVWTMATAPYKEAHFATFPPSLPATCIKAATSEYGCCAVCGRPFARITESFETEMVQKEANGWDTGPGRHSTIHREGRSNGERGVPVLGTRTIGWESDCCSLFAAGVAPCVVLDPFGGSGTTGMVALELGRSSVLIEINPEYLPLIEKRTRGGLAKLFPQPQPQPEHQGELACK